MSRSFVAASTQYLERTSAVVTAVPLTISCWFKPTDQTGDHDLVHLGQAGTSDFFRLVTSAQNVGATTSNPSDGSATAFTGNVLQASVWQHIAGTFSSSSARAVFYNGSKTTNGTTIGAPAGLDRTSVGRNSDGNTQYTDGLIGEIAVWNIVLADADIALLAGGALATSVQSGNLVDYWRCNANTSPEPSTQSSRTLTVTGATYSSDDPPVGSFALYRMFSVF